MYALFKLEHMLLYLKLQFEEWLSYPNQVFATLSLTARHLSRITDEALSYVLARRLNKSICGMRID